MNLRTILLMLSLVGNLWLVSNVSAITVDFNILFKGTELVNSRGGTQGAEVSLGRGYVNADTTINMQSAGTYNVNTLWAQGNPRNLYGTVTVDGNGDVTGVTGALVLHGPKTVGFDTAQLTAVNVLISQVSRGVQVMQVLGVDGSHYEDTAFYLPDGTYYPVTAHRPGHGYFGTFTVGGGGVNATTVAATTPNPGTVGFDLTQLTEVIVRGDLHETENGIPMQFGVTGVGVINRGSIFGSITYYVPDGTYVVATGFAPGHLEIGTFTVTGGLASTNGSIIINAAGEIEVDQSQMNAVKVTPIDTFLRWAINEQTQGFQDSNTVDTVSLPNGTFGVLIQQFDHTYVYATFTVTDGVLSETLLPVGAALVELSTNTDPVADAGLDQEVECDDVNGTSVMLVGFGSSDPDGDELEYEWSVPTESGTILDDPNSATPLGMFPLGPTLVTLTVTDGNGGMDVADVLVTVVDNTPPVLVCTTDKILLWPPNHTMRDVWICVVVSDNCSNPAGLQIDCRISSNEPDDANGDGSTTGDVDGLDGFIAPVPIQNLVYDPVDECFYGLVSLRAERDGADEGRVYSIVCDVVDTQGNEATASCVVVVPHNKRRN